MSTLKVQNLQNPSANTPAIVLDTNGNMAVNGGLAMSSSFMRNKIINGDMRIDQRNAGNSVTGNDTVFGVDRWCIEAAQTSKFTIQQNAGSVVPPPGFTNYLGITSSSAYSSLPNDYFNIVQRIEGYNVSDLDFGKSTARTITVSFWVRSSLTGTFGGSLRNAGGSRSYPFTYTISSANTWEQKSVVIPGDTTGTWPTTNAGCMHLYFNLGSGSNLSGTAGSWYSANYVNATGGTSIVGTNAATWYITGVQLEVGTVATPFERRQYGQELALCQRYYYLHCSGSALTVGGGSQLAAGEADVIVNFPVSMRVPPVLVATSGTDYYTFFRGSTADNFNSFTIYRPTNTTAIIYNATEIAGTAGAAGICFTNNASSYIAFNAEL